MRYFNSFLSRLRALTVFSFWFSIPLPFSLEVLLSSPNCAHECPHGMRAGAIDHPRVENNSPPCCFHYPTAIHTSQWYKVFNIKVYPLSRCSLQMVTHVSHLAVVGVVRGAGYKNEVLLAAFQLYMANEKVSHVTCFTLLATPFTFVIPQCPCHILAPCRYYYHFISSILTEWPPL